MTPLEIGLKEIKDVGNEDWSVTAELALHHIKTLSNEYSACKDLARRMWIQINGDDEFFEDAIKPALTGQKP